VARCPELYDWALQDQLVHVIEHVMFFGAALFYCVARPRALHRVHPPVKPGAGSCCGGRPDRYDPALRLSRLLAGRSLPDVW
jgi:hypothetical protein